MNSYLSILAETAALIETLTHGGKAVPTSVTTLLTKGLALVSAFQGAQANIVPLTSIGSALQDFETALATVKAAGIDFPEADPFKAVLDKYEATKADLEAGQAAFLGATPYSDAAKGITGKTVHYYAVFAGSTGESALIGSSG